MDFLDPFGAAVHRYQGVGTLTCGPGPRPRRSKVSFEVRQLQDGSLVVGCMAAGFVDFSRWRTLAGWAEEPSARVRVTGAMVVDSQWRSPGICWSAAYAKHVDIDKPMLHRLPASYIDFQLVNLTDRRWNGSDFPVSFSYRDYKLTLRPSATYTRLAKGLNRVPGTAVTATLRVRPAGGNPLRPAAVASAADEICRALSLAAGTKVNWLMYETSSGAIRHRSSVLKPYSNLLAALGWRLDFQAILTGWAIARDKRHLRAMTDYFMDATAVGPYLETRALTAASLLDALTNHWAHSNGFDVLVDDVSWRKAERKLRGAIRQTAAECGIDESIDINIKALQRRPFADRLQRLLGRLNIQSGHVSGLIPVRNSLIHDGEFPEGVDRRQAFLQLVWTDLAILARLAGYKPAIRGM